MTVKIIAEKDGCTNIKCIQGATNVKPIFNAVELIGLEVDDVVYTSDYFLTFEITNDPEEVELLS